MIRKNIISLSVAFAFLSLSITGILIYIKQKPHAVTITHTIFGLLFVGFAVFHILNNWDSIKGYSKDRASGGWHKELMLVAAVFGIVLIASVTELLEPIAEAGRIFAKKKPKTAKLVFDEIQTNQDLKGTTLRVLIEKNKNAEMPIITIWAEDSARNFRENLFVPAKIALMPSDEEEAKEGHFEIKDFKPEALPQWQAKATSKTPLSDKETPHDNFVVASKTSLKGAFYVLLEIKTEQKTELYEAKIDNTMGSISKLKAKDNVLIKSGLVEIL